MQQISSRCRTTKDQQQSCSNILMSRQSPRLESSVQDQDTQIKVKTGFCSRHHVAVQVRGTKLKLLLHKQLECGPMSNVMFALPNIGGALCSMPQSLADAHY